MTMKSKRLKFVYDSIARHVESTDAGVEAAVRNALTVESLDCFENVELKRVGMFHCDDFFTDRNKQFNPKKAPKEILGAPVVICELDPAGMSDKLNVNLRIEFDAELSVLRILDFDSLADTVSETSSWYEVYGLPPFRMDDELRKKSGAAQWLWSDSKDALLPPPIPKDAEPGDYDVFLRLQGFRVRNFYNQYLLENIAAIGACDKDALLARMEERYESGRGGRFGVILGKNEYGDTVKDGRRGH